MMSMTKRLQIPIEPEDARKLHEVAAQAGLSLSAWARQHLMAVADAEQQRARDERRHALAALTELQLDLGSVDELNRELADHKYQREPKR